MTAFVDYPLKVLTPSDVTVVPLYRNRSPHETTNGMRRSLGYSGAAFKVVMHKIELRGNIDKVRALRALVANLEGDRNLIRVPIPDLYSLDGPWSIATKASRAAWPAGIPFDTGVPYATGVGHAVPGRQVEILLDAAAPDNEVFVAGTSALPAGVIIGIDGFCYTIAGSWFEDGINRLKISPELHQSAPAGTMISLAPDLIGICTTDVPGETELRSAKYGSVTLEFEEDLTRLSKDFD